MHWTTVTGGRPVSLRMYLGWGCPGCTLPAFLWGCSSKLWNPQVWNCDERLMGCFLLPGGQ